MSGSVISSVPSHHSKDLKLWTSVTAQLKLSFIWQAKENTSLRHEGRQTQKKRGSILSPLFICFFLLPLNVPCVSWASQEGCWFHLRFSLQSSDFLLFHFCGFFFLSLSFSHHHLGLLLPILTT